MGILRLILLLIVGIILFKLIKPLRNLEKKAKDRYQKTADDVLVSCPRCGTYFDKGQGTMIGGKIYCTLECAKNK